MESWQQIALVALVGLATGIGGAYINARIARGTADDLGLPNDTEQRIVKLREELIDELEKEAKRREEEKDECLRQLAVEVGKREQLEHKVDDQAIQIARLLRRLASLTTTPRVKR